MDTVDLLKPRVFSAGLLFLVLTGVPCIAMARFVGLFGLRMPRVKVIDSSKMPYIRLTWGLHFWFVALGLRAASAVLFSPVEMFPRYPGWLWYLLYCGAWATANWLTDLNKRPILSIVVESLIFFYGIGLVYKYTRHDFFLETTWFYLAGIGFLWLHAVWRNPSFLRSYDWERNIFMDPGGDVFLCYFHLRPYLCFLWRRSADTPRYDVHSPHVIFRRHFGERLLGR